jgi:hypothetical protein
MRWCEATFVDLVSYTRETTSASTRMGRAGRERRCWRIRCLGWRQGCLSWRIQTLQRLPSSYMIHIVVIPSVSLPRRPCTSRKPHSSSVSFLRSHLPLRLQVFLLVGTGSHFQRSRQTLNPQARAVHLRRQLDFLFLCRSQAMRWVLLYLLIIPPLTLCCRSLLFLPFKHRKFIYRFPLFHPHTAG